MSMTQEEKEREARRLLKRNGYTENQIRKILQHAFGKKKDTRANGNPDSE